MEGNHQLIDEWIRDRQRRRFAASTIATGRREVTLLARRYGHLLGVTHHEISAWLDERGITHEESRRCYLSHLSAFYRWAVLEERCTANPVQRIPRPQHRRRLPRPIPTGDLDVALDNAHAEMRAMMLCGLMAGLRCVEISRLDREDVLDERDLPMLFVIGKRGHERTVPLHPALFAALRLHGLPRNGPLFRTSRGARRTPALVSQMIGQHFRRCGVEATAHRLRHTFATDALGECHDLRVVQELLGHQSPTATAIYAGYSSQSAWQAVRALRVAGTFAGTFSEPGAVG